MPQRDETSEDDDLRAFEETGGVNRLCLVHHDQGSPEAAMLGDQQRIPEEHLGH